MQNGYYRKVSAMVLTLMITASAAAAVSAAPTVSPDKATIKRPQKKKNGTAVFVYEDSLFGSQFNFDDLPVGRKLYTDISVELPTISVLSSVERVSE